MTYITRELFTYLETYLQSRIPGSRLEKTQLPQVPELSLYLINEDYPRDGLTREQAEALMDNPPYWGFCWASGQVLGHCVLDNPDWVKGKTLAIEDLLEEDVSNWIITVADVFYDRDNLPLLETLLDRFATVLVSDSRLKGQPLPGMDIMGDYDSHTLPDLDESREFNSVTLYRSRQNR
jgi:predicted nicotinamide N-methyase